MKHDAVLFSECEADARTGVDWTDVALLRRCRWPWVGRLGAMRATEPPPESASGPGPESKICKGGPQWIACFGHLCTVDAEIGSNGYALFYNPYM